jgi:predicted anti-sigma-YlaC factor YlaD
VKIIKEILLLRKPKFTKNEIMKTILKWASWLISAVSICFIILGSLGYLFGNTHIFGAKWGTYYLFAGYLVPLAILLVLLSMTCCEKGKE